MIFVYILASLIAFFLGGILSVRFYRKGICDGRRITAAGERFPYERAPRRVEREILREAESYRKR